MAAKGKDLTDILGYWLQCIRYEEALAARPKAWRSEAALLPGTALINLREPVAGRAYFKLPLDDVARLLAPSPAPLTKPVDGEIAEFFESWLAGRYRMVQQAEEGPEILVTCPVVQLRFGDLAGIVRFGVSLEFCYDNGDGFPVPTRSARKRGILPPPPTLARLRRIPVEEGLPFFLDGRLLSRELGATREEVDELYALLAKRAAGTATPVELLSLLTAHLDGQPRDAAAEVVLARLTRALSERLQASPHGERCYPVAIVMDARRARATWHLQRELSALLRAEQPFSGRPALLGYLSGKPGKRRRATFRGAFAPPGPTPSQREAAEVFLGSPLSAVEGPPGTGKTTLVLHLAAHLLVARVAAFSRKGKMPSDMTVVASTNNRAVDNVIDGLFPAPDRDALPLAIRVGNRRVCQEVLAPRLRQVEQWLGGHLAGSTREERVQRLQASLEGFRKTLEALDRLQAPERLRRERMAQKRELEVELERLPAADPRDALPSGVDLRALRRAENLLRRLETRLDRLSVKCEGLPSKRLLRQVRHQFDTKISPLFAKASQGLDAAGLELSIFVIPDETGTVARQVEQWEDAAEDSVSAVTDTLERLGDLISRAVRQRKRRTLEEQLARLEIPAPEPVDAAQENALGLVLFEAAGAVREADALHRAELFLDAVSAARAAAEEEASLRRFSRVQPRRFELLAELFPVWGSTLLSMGNVFGDAAGTLRRVVIDEAGQCHPAYAVSALMRCESAMILGDVHQLSPIFGLTDQDERPIRRAVVGETGDAFTDYRVFDRSFASVQRLAERASGKTVRLTDHFRCQKEIIDISNRLCGYRLTVHTPRRSRADRLPLLDRPVRFVSVPGEQERLGGSWWNLRELDEIMGWLEAILGAGIPEDELAVITPYRGQLFQLRRALVARGIPVEFSPELLDDEGAGAPLLSPKGLAVGTVHRFQGGERGIVLFSTVVTQTRSLPFLNERVNLINVAVSRARDHLVVIGHGPTLEKGRMSRLLVTQEVR